MELLSWAEEKYKECCNDSDKEEDGRTLKGICKLDSGGKMVNAAGYVLREKKIPNSGLLFTGIMLVPSDSKSGSFHQVIVDNFGGKKDCIKRIDTLDQVDAEWKTLEEAVKINAIKKVMMPQMCQDKMNNRQTCTLGELKDLIQKRKELLMSQNPSQGGPSVQSSVKEATSKKARETNVLEKDHEAVKTAVEEVEKVGEDVDDDSDEEDSDELFWAFTDRKGRIGNQYFFNEATQQQMIQMIKENPESQPAQFYIKSGILINPILQKENVLLRNRVGLLEKDQRDKEAALHAMTMDRNEKAQEVFAAGSKQVGELRIVKAEKEAAELKVTALELQVTTLEQALQLKKRDEEVIQKLEELKITTDTIKENVDKIKTTAERSISVIGAERERKDKYSTPPAESMAESGAKVVIVAQEPLFKVINSYRPLARDLDKLLRNKVLSKIVVNGDNLDMQMGVENGIVDVEKKKNAEAESTLSESQTSILDSAASILSMALGAGTAKAVLLVAGPCVETGVVTGRRRVLLKMEQDKVKTIDMTKDIAAAEGEDFKKDGPDGNWCAKTAAQLFSTIEWWVGDGYKKVSKESKVPDTCSSCGFNHGNGHCFKEDMPTVEDKEENSRQDRSEPNVSASHNSTSNQSTSNTRTSYKRPPTCFVCGNSHFGGCRARIRFCDSCETSHAGNCRPETRNLGRGSDKKSKKEFDR